jgi:hypothetical protein
MFKKQNGLRVVSPFLQPARPKARGLTHHGDPESDRAHSNPAPEKIEIQIAYK